MLRIRLSPYAAEPFGRFGQFKKARQSVDHCLVAGEIVIGGSEERQCALNLTKGLRGLHHITQGNLPAEQTWRLNDERKDHGGLTDCKVEALKLDRAEQDRPHIVDHLAEAHEKAVALHCLPPIERYAFTVFPQPNQCVTEICAELFVQVVQADKRASDPHREYRRDNYVTV